MLSYTVYTYTYIYSQPGERAYQITTYSSSRDSYINRSFNEFIRHLDDIVDQYDGSMILDSVIVRLTSASRKRLHVHACMGEGVPSRLSNGYWCADLLSSLVVIQKRSIDESTAEG